jgi:hypothetical protein
MKKYLYIFIMLPVLFACKQAEEKLDNRVISNNFEAVAGWGNCDSLVTNERAYSGSYSIKVGPENETSYTYQRRLRDIFGRKPKRIQLNAQVFGPGFQNGNASLVVQILRPEKKHERIYFKNISLAKASSFRKWVKVTREIKLPETISDSDELRLYLWRNQATQPVFADDLEVLLLE